MQHTLALKTILLSQNYRNVDGVRYDSTVAVRAQHPELTLGPVSLYQQRQQQQQQQA